MSSVWIRRSLPAVAAAAATVLALTACSSSSPSPTPAPDQSSAGAATQMQTLKVSVTGVIADGALFAGIDQGFFADEGLEIEPSIIAVPAAGLAAAQSGQVDIAFSPSVPVINGIANGIPLVMIAPADGYVDGAAKLPNPGEFDDSGIYAGATSGITSVAQLEGRKVSVPGRKAMMEVIIADAMVQAGADPTKVDWITADFASGLEGLRNGTIDAASLVTPFTFEAEADGAVRIASAVSLFEEGAVGLWVAGESTVAAKPDQIAAFVRAVERSNEFANANPDVAVQAALDFLKSDLTLAEVHAPYWPAEIRRVDIGRINNKMVKLGFLEAPINLDKAIFQG